MKTIKHPSVIPIYAMAATWLLLSLFAPMYKLPYFLLYAVILAAVWFITKQVFPGTTEQVEEPQAPPASGDPEIDQLILGGREQLQKMRTLKAQIASPKVQGDVTRLETLSEKIFSELEQNPEKLGQTKKFINYYLPTTVKLLGAYQELQNQGVQGENISSTMGKIETMLDTVEKAFQKQLDNLFEADAVDITADIQVMESMMAGEGLTGEKPDDELRPLS